MIGNRLSGQQTGLGNLGSGLDRLGNARGGGNANNAAPAPKLTARPVQRIAFGYDAPNPEATRIAVTTRLAGLATRRPELANVAVAVDGAGRHVLTGVVSDESARGLAAALVRLEPGVREVVNDLTVEGVAIP